MEHEAVTRRIEVTPYGVDVWAFEPGLEGGEVPCLFAKRLLLFLWADTTREVHVRPVNEYTQTATVEVLGPEQEDGIPLEVVYKVSRREINHPGWGFTRNEKKLLYKGVARRYPPTTPERARNLERFVRALGLGAVL